MSEVAVEVPSIAPTSGSEQAPRFDAETHPSALDYVPLPIVTVAVAGSAPVRPPPVTERADDAISLPVAPARSIRGARGPPSDHA